MNEDPSAPSRVRLLDRLRGVSRTRDPRVMIALAAVGAVIVGSLSIVGVAYAQSDGSLFASPGGTSAVDKTSAGQTSKPSTPAVEKPADPEPVKTTAPDPKSDPSAKPSSPPSDKPTKPKTPVEWTPETLDQIMAAVNAYRAGQGVAAYGPLGDNCEKIDYAWSDSQPGGRISTNLIAEHPGPFGRTVSAPHWMAASPYWTDDGKSGGVPAVKIKIYQCFQKAPSSPPSTPPPSTPPADPTPTPSAEPTS
jgi:hypothetical protein